MKKTSVFITLFSVVALTVSAQKKLYLSQHPKWVEWADTPAVHPVPPEHATQPAIVLLNDISIDYRVEGGYIVKHSTRHSVIKLLDDRGIYRYNTIPIYLNRGTKVPTFRARTISPTGKVQNFDKNRLFYGYDDNGNYVLYMNLEGIERNSEIEYLVKEINPNDNFGKVVVQQDIPVLKTRFQISFRKNMVIETRSLNGFPKLTTELANNRMRYKVELDEIAPLLPEKNAFYGLHTMALDYRVSYYVNENEEKIKLNTYNNLGRKLYDENYKFTSKEKAAVNQFLSELGVRPGGDELRNIRKIEDGIKKNISLYPFVDFEERKEVNGLRENRSMSLYAAGYEDTRDVLDTIISKRASGYRGYIRLFAACLTQAGIKHEIGWAWNRTEYNPNPGFESWRGLNHTLIYLPAEKKFLAPTEKFLRYPVIPQALAGSKGVFCTIPMSGELTGTVHKVRTITPLSVKENRHDIATTVSFTKDMDASVNVSHEWAGYSSAGIRTALPFVRPENMKKYVAGLLQLSGNPADIAEYSFSNEELTNYYSNRPLTLTASATLPNLVNKAGNKYLLKVGALIGPQEHMYEEKPRVMPVDLLYPHSAHRTITVSIPKGYKIANPEAATMSADYLNGELEQVINFTSVATLIKDNKNGDRLVIDVTESYSQLHFPTIEFDRFRKVWNTAADFNNVALVLTKK